MNSGKLHSGLFDTDLNIEAGKVKNLITDYLIKYKKRGVVIALSGGVDSTVSAYMIANSIDSNKILGIYMPEKDIADDEYYIREKVIKKLGINFVKWDITKTLESLDCYKARDDAIKRLFKDYDGTWKHKITIVRKHGSDVNYFNLVIEDGNKEITEVRLPHREYLEIVAATNYKQRVRKNVEYYYAEKMNYAVAGTSNRVELDQGFFVKNGDGAADIKIVSHLYKSQIFSLARQMGVDEEICKSVPTSNTYSLHQQQEEFYFSLPFPQMDYALWAIDNNISPGELADFLGMQEEEIRDVYNDIISKRKKSEYNHMTVAINE